MTTPAEARTIETILKTASEHGPRQLRYEMAKRAKEWGFAAAMLETDDLDDFYVIEVAAAVVPGMRVAMADGDLEVIRQMQRDGQLTLHMDDEGHARYLNLFCGASPVVVRG